MKSKTLSIIFRYVLLIILVGLSLLVDAQTQYPCGAVEMQKELYLKNKKWMDMQEKTEQVLFRKKGGFVGSRSTDTYTLPVVVHVVHNNGNENISDDQIEQAISHLNAAFSHTGPYQTKGEGFDTKIQFCLANRTPDNQSTTGINRVISNLTNMTMETQDEALKNLSRWDPNQYINIWVVNEITSQSQGSGVAGYAYLAGMHGQPVDGMVCEAKFFGKTPADDVVFIHEMGHYLNLLHTFDGGCTNNLCDQEGDKVCDTPPDQALHSACVFNSCGTDKNDPRAINPFTTDVNDMTQNYMDYSPFECQFAFTKGQSERMRLTIENIRESLLQSDGCLSPCLSTISGSISAPTEAVTGEKVNLSFSGAGATTYVWTVNGTQIGTSATPEYVFTAPGTYTITLVAGNQDVNCIYKTKHTITVKCNILADFNPILSVVKEGESIRFTSTSTGAKDYVWKIDGTPAGSGSSLDYTFTQTKDYLVQLEVSNEYCSQIKTGKVSVQSACGDSIWQYQIANDKDYEYFTAPLKDGSFYYSATADNLNSRLVGFIDKNGIHKWSYSYSTPNSSRPVPYILSDGGLLVLENLTIASNSFLSATKFNQNGDKIWSASYNIPSVLFFHALPLKDGIIIATGTYLLYLDNDGQVKWSKVMPTVDDYITSVQKTENDNHIWAIGHGLDNGVRKMKLIKMDLAGNILNSFFIMPSQSMQLGHRFLGSFNDGSIALHLSNDGNPLDNYIMCMGKTGIILWQKKYNGILNSINIADNKLLITAYKLPERQYEMVILDTNGTKLSSATTTEKNFGNQNYISSNGSLWVIPMTWQNVTTFINLNSNAIQSNCYIKSSNFDLQNESGWTTEPYNSLPFLTAQVQKIPAPLVNYTLEQTQVLKTCRTPNPCPKNCNEEVSHLKLIKEKRSNTFQVHPGSNDELLLSGFAVEDETYYYGTLKKDGSFAKINSFSSNQKNGLQKYIEHENFRYLIMSDGPNFVLKKETLNGVEVFTKVYNGVKKDITVHIYNERLLGSGGNFAFCLDLDGNMLWNKSILKNDAAPVNVASKDGIWNVFVNSLLELHITKIDIHGTLEISKIVKLPYPSNSNFIQGVASDLGGLVFKLGLTLPEGVRNILVKVDKNGSVEYSKYVENDTGSFAGYSENSGYVLHHTVIPTSAGVERKFNLFNPDGDIVYTKELSVACDVNQISKFKHGWILNCRAADGDYIVYIFPETTEDCMIKNSLPVKTFELSLSSENTNLTISDLPNIMPNNMTELVMENFNMAASKVCEIFIPCIEICDNGIDDDDNGLTDCNDPSCLCNTCLNKADLVLSSIDSIHCIGNDYMATLTICNKGDADFNGNVPLVFYDGNPWEKSVNALSTSLLFVGSLQKDSCTQVTYRFAKFRDGEIFAVINAKENLVTPFDQNTIFSDVDCNTTNNTKSIRFAPSIPTLDLGPDVEICRGQIVNLSAQEGFSSYQWQDFYPNKNYSAFTPGLYSVTVSDYCGNLLNDEILIKEKKLAPILLGDDKSICEGSTIEVNYSTTMNGKFVWDDGLEGAYRKLDTAGRYTLGFYTPDNCVVKDTIEVKVIPAPILNLEDSIAICEGSSHTVTLSQSDLKYDWYDGDVSSTKVFNQAGVYTVSASNDVCTVQDSFMIEIIQKPILNLPDTLSFCKGDSILISLQPQQTTSYVWNTGEKTPNIIVNKPGIYTLEANTKNCISSDTIFVNELTKPVVSLQPKTNACEGDTVNLSVNLISGQNAIWSTGQTTPNILISSSGNYTVQISNDACNVSDTTDVIFYKRPSVSLPEELDGCEGEKLKVNLPVANDITEIKWSDGSKDAEREFDTSGKYSLIMKNEHCTTQDTIQITFHALPETIDLGQDTTLCEEIPLDIFISENSSYSYSWNDGITKPSRRIDKQGRYTLNVSNRFGCEVSDSIDVKFVPFPDFDLGIDTTICVGDSMHLRLILPGEGWLQWDDMSTDQERTLYQAGRYTATYSYYGCESSDDIEIMVSDCNPFDIHFPNVFRYNSAENGIFKPVINGDTQSITNYSMKIYDRWGSLVFKSLEPEDGWNGNFSGQVSESGVYVYTLHILYSHQGQANQVQKQGSVTLLK